MSIETLNTYAMFWFVLMLAGVFGVVASSQAGIRLILCLFAIVAALQWADYVDQWHDKKYPPSKTVIGSGTE